MKSVQFFAMMLVAALCLSYISGCTSNPFGDDDVSSKSGQIRGSVQLSDGASSEGVYVWLEGFNVGTRVDANGKFQVNLPPPSSQGTSGGVSGVFDLYFYLANYQLASSQVVTRNGEFVYSSGDINSKGELYSPKVLKRFLRINTLVTPASVRTNYAGVIAVKVTLVATIDSATVIFPGAVGGFWGAILLKRVGSEEVYGYQSVPGATTRDIQIIGRTPRERIMEFNLLQRPLPPAEYEVIPHLLIRHEVIPTGLMASLGTNVEELGPNYLKIPFRREGGQFKITN